MPLANFIELVFEVLGWTFTAVVLLIFAAWVADRLTLTREECEEELTQYAAEKFKERGVTPDDVARMRSGLEAKNSEVKNDEA